VQARYRLGEGDLDAAEQWAQTCGLSLDDDSTYNYHVRGEHFTLARVRIAQARKGVAGVSLDGVLRFLMLRGEEAETQGRVMDLIRILVLQALARQAQGDVEGAVEALARALAQAEPEGFVRTFVDEGEPMANLLREAASRGIAPGYAAKLLATYGEKPAPVKRTTPAAQPLVEPLSERELEVLRLLAEGLTDREIAEQLTVTLGTAKTHVSHIYGKLGVHSRVQAVTRARELGLLES
jgi:LuxR family maltose regulon positive regulatory protein